MFKCHHKKFQSIPLTSVCDGRIDCHFGDDELFCAIVHCPNNCLCFLYAIQCDNATKLRNLERKHFVYVSILNSKISIFPLLLSESVYFLTLKNSTIGRLCGANLVKQGLISIEISHSFSGIIEEDCFSNRPDLRVIRLSDNNISSVQHNSFRNLTKLNILNLTNNPLSSLSAAAFVECTSMKYLHLFFSSSFTQLDTHREALAGLPMNFTVHTDNLALCCVASVDRNCLYSGLSEKLCWHLLPGVFRYICLSVSVLLILSDFASLLIHHKLG